MKQQNKQSSQPLFVFSVIFLLYITLSLFLNDLSSVPVKLVLMTVLAFGSIVGALEIWLNGYMRNPKFQNIFTLMGGTLHGNSYLLQF